MIVKGRSSAALAVGFAILFALGAALAWADVTLPKLELRDTHLENGLRVILIEDHSAPVYSIDVCYNVGSRNERPGRTGFAHLFELHDVSRLGERRQRRALHRRAE